MKDRYLGLFDSGAGGLTVVKILMDLLPNENIIYFGDTLNMPYGDKDTETLQKIVLDDIAFLSKFKLKTIGIACNTLDATSINMSLITSAPVYGVIYPASLRACEITTNNKIGVLATQATVNSKVYENTLKQLNPLLDITMIPCAKLAPLVEEGKIKCVETKQALLEYLNPLKEKGIDTLILGCTHYHALIDEIKTIMPEVNIVSSSECLAYEIKNHLINTNLLNDKLTDRKIYVSSNPEKFKQTVETIIGKNNIEVLLK